MTYKELSEVSTDEPVEVTWPNVPIYIDTQCFIDKGRQVTWRKIYSTFMQERFVKDLEYLKAYVNIRRYRIHRITCRFLVMPCVEVIEWIITHMDDSHLVLQSESGGHLTIYHGEDMQTYYKMLKPTEYVNDNFYRRYPTLETIDVIKHGVKSLPSSAITHLQCI